MKHSILLLFSYAEIRIPESGLKHTHTTHQVEKIKILHVAWFGSGHFFCFWVGGFPAFWGFSLSLPNANGSH